MNEMKLVFQRELSCLYQADIIVVGAGPSGCAAAITAARMGCRTLLVERYGFPGGATVNQLVPVVLSQNGVDFQGIWHEFMLEMKTNGLVNEMVKGEQCDHWLCATYSPESAKHAWDKLLVDAGVVILYHALVTDVITCGNKIKSLILNTRGGNFFVDGKLLVDCTGDGQVCFLAGKEFELGNEQGPVSQAATKMFRLVNSIKPEYVMTPEKKHSLKNSFHEALRNKEFDSPVITTGFIMDYINNRAGKQLPDNTLLINATRMINVNSLDPWQLSQAEIDGRKYAKECADFFIKYVPGSENALLLETSMELGIRASRRIIGLATLTIDDVLSLRKFPDGIAKGSWEVDVHPPKDYTYKRSADIIDYETYHERIATGDYYEIPLGCLIPKDSENLLVAGRCISADSESQGSLRIQQTCMATGEASGCLAALSILFGKNPQEIDSGEIVRKLSEIRNRSNIAFEILKPLLLKE